jgi:hypothetical protein
MMSPNRRKVGLQKPFQLTKLGKWKVFDHILAILSNASSMRETVWVVAKRT